MTSLVRNRGTIAVALAAPFVPESGDVADHALELFPGAPTLEDDLRCCLGPSSHRAAVTGVRGVLARSTPQAVGAASPLAAAALSFSEGVLHVLKILVQLAVRLVPLLPQRRVESDVPFRLAGNEPGRHPGIVVHGGLVLEILPRGRISEVDPGPEDALDAGSRGLAGGDVLADFVIVIRGLAQLDVRGAVAAVHAAAAPLRLGFLAREVASLRFL